MVSAHPGRHTLHEKEYLFIDGGCLRVAATALSEEITGNADTLRVLYPSFAGNADKVFYYDAISAQEHREPVADYQIRVQAEHDKFDAIRALDRYHVALGEVKGRVGNRRQKQVDVRLSVDMLTHTFRGNMHRATLFAGDDDFIPLVEALVREGMTVTIWHPPQASEALLAAADNRRPFSVKSAHMLLTRDGSKSAFSVGVSGGSAQPDDGSIYLTSMNSIYRYCGKWENDDLTIWRSSNDLSWEFIRLSSPGASIKEALLIFRSALGWDVSELAVDELTEKIGESCGGI
jgi:uncharacterized LabA/DUF88 family protein